MFDWDDEELSDIIWGETGGDNDHLVPYPVENDAKPPASHGDSVVEEWNIESLRVKPGHQKKLDTKSDSHIRLESSSKHAADEARPAVALSMDSWSGLSSCTEPSKNSTEISKHEDGSIQQGTNSKFFQKQQEDGEQSDFVGYDWDSIRSFDDLDKIFCNDDPIFGHASLPNTDELWSSTKDLPSSPEKHFPMSIESPNLGLGELRSTIENFETEEEYILDQYQPFSRAYDEVNNIAPNVSEMIPTYDGDKEIPVVKQQTALDLGGEVPAFSLQLDTRVIGTPNQPTGKDLCGSWTTSIKELNSQYASVNQQCPSVVLSQPNHLQGPQSLQYNQNLSSPTLASHVPGDFANQYHMTFTPFNAGPTLKSVTMTPREKIEKLRRRQQMRAMIAIQRKQQEFSDQPLSTKHSMEVEGSFGPLSSVVDPNSPSEQNGGSSTAGVVVEDHSGEESVLNRLQEIISKLDIRIRLCIRDSLFRLARSADQRQHTDNDTNSTNKGIQEFVVKQEELNSNNSNYKIARLPNVEAETNPIDRTVAHLLFHQPMDVLSTKAAELPQPHPPDKLYYDNESKRSLPHSHLVTSHGLKAPRAHAEGEQPQHNPCLESCSENATKSEAADSGVMAVGPPSK
ncbi:hypothetical protein DM860_014598 [Cuscuta australis]|uniref:Protein LNK2 n=1 Tax=Cuscuta australis TaxID=267555 RepID=A0A328DKN6_9ASTE|nr:hypothetical protein DM860_014598 [Cuscuta australis]